MRKRTGYIDGRRMHIGISGGPQAWPGAANMVAWYAKTLHAMADVAMFSLDLTHDDDRTAGALAALDPSVTVVAGKDGYRANVLRASLTIGANGALSTNSVNSVLSAYVHDAEGVTIANGHMCALWLQLHMPVCEPHTYSFERWDTYEVQAKIPEGIYAQCDMDALIHYVMPDGTGWHYDTTVAGSEEGYIKVRLGTNDRYIKLFTEHA